MSENDTAAILIYLISRTVWLVEKRSMITTSVGLAFNYDDGDDHVDDDGGGSDFM